MARLSSYVDNQSTGRRRRPRASHMGPLPPRGRPRLVAGLRHGAARLGRHGRRRHARCAGGRAPGAGTDRGRRASGARFDHAVRACMLTRLGDRRLPPVALPDAVTEVLAGYQEYWLRSLRAEHPAAANEARLLATLNAIVTAGRGTPAANLAELEAPLEALIGGRGGHAAGRARVPGQADRARRRIDDRPRPARHVRRQRERRPGRAAQLCQWARRQRPRGAARGGPWLGSGMAGDRRRAHQCRGGGLAAGGHRAARARAARHIGLGGPRTKERVPAA